MNGQATYTLAEEKFCDAIILYVRCKNYKKDGTGCNHTWGVRLNPDIGLEENLRIISIQKYICSPCSKALERQSEGAVEINLISY